MTSTESLLDELKAIEEWERQLSFQRTLSYHELLEHRARLRRKEEIEEELRKRKAL